MYTIRNVDLTRGMPKICVPVFGKNAETLAKACEAAKEKPFDVIEWRVDYLEKTETWKEALSVIRDILPDAPLLATFRTKEEGGEKEISEENYFSLLSALTDSGNVDAVDMEYLHEKAGRKKLMAEAEAAGIPVIVSSHDFHGTPEEGEMEAMLEMMLETGGIAKLAVMPEDAADVLALLIATAAVKAEHPETPIITMAMGPVGVITRVAGETFGSAMTFGSAKEASAPGQIDAETLSVILHALHGK